MFHRVLNFFRTPPCKEHDFEIVTRAREVCFSGGSSVEVDFYEDTIATCIHCEYRRTLNSVRSNRFLNDGELIAIHRDPLRVYRHIKIKQ